MQRSFTRTRRTVLLVCALAAAVWFGASRLDAATLEPGSAATDILIAEPVDSPVNPAKWKVVEVIAGGKYKAGEVIKVVCPGIYPERNLPGAKSSASGGPAIGKALLFIGPPAPWERPDDSRPTRAGIRALGVAGDVYVPVADWVPAVPELTKQDGTAWDSLVAKIRADAAEVARVRGLFMIADPGERNRELLRWLEENRPEFRPEAGGLAYVSAWCGLEHEVFQRIMKSCVAADCWRAMTLYRDYFPRAGGYYGDLEFRFDSPSFCTPEGRSLLLSELDDSDLGDARRLLILRELVAPRTLYRDAFREYAGYSTTSTLTSNQHGTLLVRLTALLDDPRPAWRSAAAVGIANLGNPHFRPPRAEPERSRALNKLHDLFATENDQAVFESVAEAINSIENGAGAFVRKDKGGPFCLLVKYLGVADGKVRLQLSYRSPNRVPDAVSFDLRTTNPGNQSGRSIVWAQCEIDPEQSGRRAGSMIVTIPRDSLRPGMWVLRGAALVEYRADKADWTASEAHFSVPAHVLAGD